MRSDGREDQRLESDKESSASKLPTLRFTLKITAFLSLLLIVLLLLTVVVPLWWNKHRLASRFAVARGLPGVTLALTDGNGVMFLSLASREATTVPQVAGRSMSLLTPHYRLGREWILMAGHSPVAGGSLLKWYVTSGEVKEVFSSSGLCGWPSESPDGRLVAFLEKDVFVVGGTCHLYLGQVIGDSLAKAELVSKEVARGYVQWMPDGESFLYTASDGRVCGFEVESREITRYPARGMVTLLEGAKAIVVLENGEVLRLFTFPDLELTKELRLRHSALPDTQAIALNEDHVAYLVPLPNELGKPGTGLIVVDLGDENCQALVHVVTGSRFGSANVTELKFAE